jgi:hypothetical protein
MNKIECVNLIHRDFLNKLLHPIMAAVKKKDVVYVCRTFQSRWIHQCFIICIKGDAVCIACNKNVPLLKEYNVKRHCATKHTSQSSGL